MPNATYPLPDRATLIARILGDATEGTDRPTAEQVGAVLDACDWPACCETSGLDLIADGDDVVVDLPLPSRVRRMPGCAWVAEYFGACWDDGVGAWVRPVGVRDDEGGIGFVQVNSASAFEADCRRDASRRVAPITESDLLDGYRPVGEDL